jgi:hypothetical protein
MIIMGSELAFASALHSAALNPQEAPANVTSLVRVVCSLVSLSDVEESNSHGRINHWLD